MSQELSRTCAHLFLSFPFLQRLRERKVNAMNTENSEKFEQPNLNPRSRNTLEIIIRGKSVFDHLLEYRNKGRDKFCVRARLLFDQKFVHVECSGWL